MLGLALGIFCCFDQNYSIIKVNVIYFLGFVATGITGIAIWRQFEEQRIDNMIKNIDFIIDSTLHPVAPIVKSIVEVKNKKEGIVGFFKNKAVDGYQINQEHKIEAEELDKIIGAVYEIQEIFSLINNNHYKRFFVYKIKNNIIFDKINFLSQQTNTENQEKIAKLNNQLNFIL
jgi:hypothetical protein